MLGKVNSDQHQKRDQDNSQHSNSFGSTILAGSGRCPSQKSSDSSFYSAESTIVTRKLPTSRCDESSIAIKDSLNSVTDFSADIESSTTASCQSSSAMDENIESKCFTSTPASTTSVRSDLDLNKAQNLFTSTESHNRDTNYNVDGASNASYSVCEEENLQFLVGNLSTSEYDEIPQFLQKFKSLTRNVDSETSKEVTRRLTSSFHQDPQEFANRLITIIEESDTNYELEKTAVSVNKMVSAYLKLCKYVEEESMPSMIDISHVHREVSPVACSGPLQNIIDEHVLNETTPPNSGTTTRRFGPKISPKNHRKKGTKTLSSPLYVSTLTRAATTTPTQTPTPLTTPESTPGSARNHNDSTFTHWEKKCMVSPHEKRGCDTPDITDEEKLRLAEAEKQLHLLQAAASPNPSPIRTQINIYNINCERQESSSEFETFLSPKLKYDMDISSKIQSSYDENDMMESIMYELAEKRKRCYETERTIRQIDAESSAYSISPTASENKESEKILGFLNALRNRSDDPKIMGHNRKQPHSPPKHNNKCKGTSKHSSDISKGVQNNRNLNVTMRKPAKTADSRSKSPTVTTSRNSLSARGVKSKKSSNYDKFPTPSRRVASAHLKAVSISPIDGPSISGFSKSTFASQNPKTSSTQLTRTPRAKSPKIETYPPMNTKNRQMSKTQEPTTKKSTVPKTRSGLCSTGITKSADRQKSQLQNADKGFTLKYMNSLSRSRSPSVNHKNIPTATKPQRGKEHCLPTLTVTNATPNTNGYKKSCQPRALGEKNGNTPTQNKCRDGKGKFFNTPGKTPQLKIRPKPMTFFSVVDGERKPLQRSQLLTQYYNPGEIKSPVAEYVNGTDTTLLQNIRGMKNEYLLTPKKQTKGPDQLKF